MIFRGPLSHSEINNPELKNICLFHHLAIIHSIEM